MHITTKDICDIVQGELVGDPDVIIKGPSKIEEGKKGTISFLANPKYNTFAYSTEASALLVSKDFQPTKEIKPTLIKVENVYSSLSKLLSSFNHVFENEGIAETSIIKENCHIPDSVSIGEYSVVSKGVSIGEQTFIADQVFIGQDVTIGKNAIIYPGVKIYHNCVIGDHVIIHSNAIIGSDGFGFVPNTAGHYEKIPQVGNVVIEDYVEIGANTTIDRATMGSTRLCKGVKLDNLIQIAHNVVVGENTVIAAQTGIAGSTKIGKNCQIGGQVGIAGHLEVPDNMKIQGQSGITSSNYEKGQQVYGTPAINYREFLKSYAHFKNLPDLSDEIKALKAEIEILKSSKR
ncbi:UDP-3-O-(3-hydroxymyristoyl)glucosamine N-acyltransferase [Portibacter marinus]|uniref:UDP-3-O-(3-hydroxymyristoyl)glucosamine N-acyltransferase n=1 Tax=Portibacter marinus TaxID=2898660 RepID=UPI001F474610|nr:UDP-3-O-(3-hydroxymyristoyl)glucosamine N-acyltransferase [Portibacter marinus]